MATLSKSVVTVVTSGTVTAGTPLRGAIATQTDMGGILTIKITNGGTGPTVQCSAYVMVAHDVSGTPPATGAAGATWKNLFGPYGGGTTANAVSEYAVEIPWGVGALQVEFSGNTAQNVTAEAILTKVTGMA